MLAYHIDQYTVDPFSILFHCHPSCIGVRAQQDVPMIRSRITYVDLLGRRAQAGLFF